MAEAATVLSQVQPFAPDALWAARITAARESRGSMRARIKALLDAAAPEGFTDEEISNLLAALSSSVSRARRDLVKEGHAADSGDRRQSPTSTGLAAVWVARP